VLRKLKITMKLPLLPLLLMSTAAFAEPHVEIVNLWEDQTISGVYLPGIEADVIGVEQEDIDVVLFYLSGYLWRAESVPPYSFNGDDGETPYPFDTTVFPNGNYDLTAVAYYDYDTNDEIGLASVNFEIFNNHPPKVQIEADVNYGELPLTVHFTSNAYDPDEQELFYYWTFGDGGTSFEANPVYTFNTAKSYMVRIVVTDEYDARVTDRISIRAGLMPHLEIDGMVIIEAEDYDLWSDYNEQEWAFRQDRPGYSGARFIRHIPDTSYTHNDGLSPTVEFWIDFLQTTRYYLWIRGYPLDDGASCWIKLNGSTIGESFKWEGKDGWLWSNNTPYRETIDVQQPGLNVLTISGREDGLSIDKIILTTNPDFQPQDTGPPSPPRAARAADPAGDANFDGTADLLDLVFIRNRIGTSVNESNNRWADLNADGIVDVGDVIDARNSIDQ